MKLAKLRKRPWMGPCASVLAGAAVALAGRALTRREHLAKLAAANAELRLANERLQAIVEELHRADRIKGEFLNTVSHDLRIPLTTITGYAELLQEKAIGPLSDEQVEAVVAILAASDRMKRLLEDLLDFAKMEAGRFRLDIRDTNIGDLVAEAIEGIRPLANRKHQDLEARGELDFPPIPVDPGRILQVLNNLLSNAVKYTPQGGRIGVSWRRKGDEVAIAVSDNGVGIPKELQPKLFSKFFRVDQPGAPAGHGLGLAISKALVDAHGGRIELESEPGKGSTFTIYLPTRTPRHVKAASQPGQEAGSRPTMT